MPLRRQRGCGTRRRNLVETLVSGERSQDRVSSLFQGLFEGLLRGLKFWADALVLREAATRQTVKASLTLYRIDGGLTILESRRTMSVN